MPWLFQQYSLQIRSQKGTFLIFPFPLKFLILAVVHGTYCTPSLPLFFLLDICRRCLIFIPLKCDLRVWSRRLRSSTSTFRFALSYIAISQIWSCFVWIKSDEAVFEPGYLCIIFSKQKTTILFVASTSRPWWLDKIVFFWG